MKDDGTPETMTEVSAMYFDEKQHIKRLRDAFAIAALPPVVRMHTEAFGNYDKVAEIAYKYADAMLKERSRDA